MKKNGKSEWGHFSGKNWNERQSDNLSGMENKDKSNARLSLGLNRIVDVKKHVVWQSLLSPFSPHFMRAEKAGWTGGEDEEIQSMELSWISISDPTRKMGQNEYYDKVYKAKLVLLDLGRDGQIVRASYLCSDLVWPWATWPWLVFTENHKIIIS